MDIQLVGEACRQFLQGRSGFLLDPSSQKILVRGEPGAFGLPHLFRLQVPGLALPLEKTVDTTGADAKHLADVGLAVAFFPFLYNTLT